MCFPHMENEEEKKLWKTMDDGKNIGVIFFDEQMCGKYTSKI